MLTRSDLRELGLQRGAVDAVFRALPVIVLPGYSRPMVRAEDYLAFVAEPPTGTIACRRHKIRQRSGERPDGAAGNGHRPDSTKTCKEVSIVTSTVTPAACA